MVVYLAAEGRVRAINYREKAPGAAHPRMFLDEVGKVRRDLHGGHGLAVGVPGAAAGWDYALKTYGTQDLEEVIGPALRFAEQGFEVSPTLSAISKDEYEKVLANSGEDSTYLNLGLPLEPGDIFRNPDLAATFRTLAEKGVREFYEGVTAGRIVSAVRDAGGILTAEDLASYTVEDQEPLRGTYKDLILFTVRPPASGGLHVIQILNILENWEAGRWEAEPADYIHRFCEALRFVFADRARYLGDPDFVDVPVEGLISKSHAAAIAALIDPGRVRNDYPSGDFDPGGEKSDNTTHLCVIDEEGNIVSLTQSINDFFGSGIVPGGTGFLLNNHMDDFSDDPGSVNAPRPGRRPTSSMGPLIVFRAGKPYLALGSPGGPRIFPTLAQIIVNVVEFGMGIDQAIEAPRFFSFSSHGKAGPLSVESRIPGEVVRRLQELGHEVEVREAYDRFFGGAQGLLLTPGKSVIRGGADSRRDGSGAGY